MSASLQQINITYHPKEDRLLLRVSVSDDAEYRLWLTRRFTGLLLQVLNEQIRQFGGHTDLATRQETREQLKGSAFGKQYTPAPEPQFPLGEQGILAFRINSGTTEDGRANLQLLPEDGGGLHLTLDKTMLFLIHNLLEQGLATADWNLPGLSMTTEALH